MTATPSRTPTIAGRVPAQWQVLTSEQAADALGMTPEALRTLRSRGGGPRYRQLSPSRIGYTVGDVVAYLEQCAVEPTSTRKSKSDGPAE